jgi:hypothetical protein
VRAFAVHQAGDVLGRSRVSAEQAVVPEHPEIAAAGDGRGGRLRNLVFVHQPLDGRLGQETGQFVVFETGQRQVELVELQIGQFELEQLVVPARILMRAVVHQPVGAQLRRRQAMRDMHRHARHTEPLGRLVAGVADDDHHVLVDDDRLTPAELGQRGGDRGDSLLVAARVARIGHKLVDRRFDDVHGRSGAMGEGSDPAVAKPADALCRRNQCRFADALETKRPRPAASPSPRHADA